jgi:predicted membrane-bound spermidine synthase
MADDQIDYDKINRRVEARIKARKDFQGVVLGFLITCAAVWPIYLLTDPGGFAWPLIPTAVMAVVVIWQALETYFLAEARERERDRLTEREIERERARLYDEAVLEKPKRDRTAHLSDDGELIYEDEERRAAQRRR